MSCFWQKCCETNKAANFPIFSHFLFLFLRWERYCSYLDNDLATLAKTAFFVVSEAQPICVLGV